MNESREKVLMYNGTLFSHKKNKISSSAETWTDLQGIMLNEISQTENNNYCMNHLYGIYFLNILFF